MASTIILSDNGVSSGSAGLKETGGNDGVLLLQTATSGGTATTALAITNTQNVGIGNTAPLVKLVVGAAQTAPDTSTYAQFSGAVEFCSSSALSYRCQIETDSSATYFGSNTYYAGGWQVYDSGRAPAQMQMVSTNLDSYISFYTSAANSGNGTERMRIDKSGNLLLGTTSTSPGYLNTTTGSVLNPNGLNCFSRSGADFSVVVNNNTGSTYYLIAFRAAGVSTGSITSNGTTTSYTTTSDYRLKENIAPMTGALAVLNQLKPCTYTWKSNGSESQGFIAHELAEVVPDAVTGEKDAVDEEGNIKPQGIDTSFLVATLTAAIQEQQALITTLTERITALEAK